MYDDKIGGLLGMLANWDTDKPFYVVAHRPLDYEHGEKKHNTSESIGHEHFIRNDGANFGFAREGEFTEPLSALDGYTLTPKYGLKLYDAATLDQARKNWNTRNEEMEKVVDDMDLHEHVLPRLYSEYAFDVNNCKDYVQWLDQEYDQLMKGTASGR